MNVTVQGIAVEFDRDRLFDYRNMKRLYSFAGDANLAEFDKWGSDVFGAEQWESMIDRFAESHDGSVPIFEWVGFVNEVINTAKETDETSKNS
jgi:hypothetical protein